MPKATHENKLSRRTVIGGIAATPILAVPAIATVEADPIFAAIEAHAATYIAFECASNRTRPLREMIKVAGFDRLPRVEYVRRLTENPGEFAPEYFRTAACIERHIENFRSSGLYDAPKPKANLAKLRERLLNALREDEEAIKRAEQESGYADARAEYFDAAEAENAATERANAADDARGYPRTGGFRFEAVWQFDQR